MAIYRTLGPITYVKDGVVQSVDRAGVRVDLSPAQASLLEGLIAIDHGGENDMPRAQVVYYDSAAFFPDMGYERYIYVDYESGIFYRWNSDSRTYIPMVVGGGIVNSVNGKIEADVVLDADDILDGTTSHKFATAAQLSKLDDINTEADRNRANHTGEQAISTVTGLDTALGNKVDKGTGNTRVYIRNGSGLETTGPYTTAATASTFPLRDANGTFEVGTPTSANHPWRKTDADTFGKAVTKIGYTGAGSPTLYYEIGRLPIDNSGNSASVSFTGRLGGFTTSNSLASWSIILGNRTAGYTGDTVTAAVMAQGFPAAALTSADVEVYSQADKSAIVYLKVNGYYNADLRGSGSGNSLSATGTVGLVDTPVTPTGTKIWALSTAPRLEVGSDGKLTVATPTAAGHAVPKSYVDSWITTRQPAFLTGTVATAAATAAKTTTLALPTAGDIVVLTYTNGQSANAATVTFATGGAIPILTPGGSAANAWHACAAGAAIYYRYTGAALHTLAPVNVPEISNAEIIDSGSGAYRLISGTRAEYLMANEATKTRSLSNKTLVNPFITNYTETAQAISNSGTAKTLAITGGTIIPITMNGNCTFTMPAATEGKTFMVRIYTGAGGFTGTFTGVKWAGGTAPTLTATAGRMDLVSFFSDGTNWYGSIVQNFTP